jgi:hypothetical protein
MADRVVQIADGRIQNVQAQVLRKPVRSLTW